MITTSKNKGFTLVEIMIVVAIIALISAIAIPNLLRAKLSANETAAISSVRTIAAAMENWRMARTPPTYAGASLNRLAAERPPYIDRALGSRQKQGYRFTLFALDQNRFFCWAWPQRFTRTGNRFFLYPNYTMGGLQGGVIYAWDPFNPGWRPIE